MQSSVPSVSSYTPPPSLPIFSHHGIHLLLPFIVASHYFLHQQMTLSSNRVFGCLRIIASFDNHASVNASSSHAISSSCSVMVRFSHLFIQIFTLGRQIHALNALIMPFLTSSYTVPHSNERHSDPLFATSFALQLFTHLPPLFAGFSLSTSFEPTSPIYRFSRFYSNGYRLVYLSPHPSTSSLPRYAGISLSITSCTSFLVALALISNLLFSHVLHKRIYPHFYCPPALLPGKVNVLSRRS